MTQFRQRWLGGGPAFAGFGLLLAVFLFAVPGWGYYHFLHYGKILGPEGAAPQRFDVGALPGGALPVLVAEKGPEAYRQGDSFSSLISYVRMAANVWDKVPTSSLRLRYGGLFSPNTPQISPRVEFLFDELPPGLLAMGGPTSVLGRVESENGDYVPIAKSVVVLANDFSNLSLANDNFFLTLVHELGHALGLQHTLSSSVMSTSITRATTKAKPISSDDIAGLSLLYPTAEFLKNTGSIEGKVVLGGKGVHLASVVALKAGSSATSALTHPDGSFRIAGLSPGQYYIYVHALPPAFQEGLGPADIVLPQDASGKAIPAGGLIQTEFYPGVQALKDASVIAVKAGEATRSMNFNAKPTASLSVYDVTTYSFPGQLAVKPAFVEVNGKRQFLVAWGRGLSVNNAPAPGLNVSLMGGAATVPSGGVHAYGPAPAYVQVNFQFQPFGGPGPHHLLFGLNGNLHVLPSGLNLVNQPPPLIQAAEEVVAEDGAVRVEIKGTNLGQQTLFYFDGYPATVAEMKEDGPLYVIPPPGADAHQASIVALNADGQASSFLQLPLSYTYPAALPAAVRVKPASLPAGAEAMVEVTGVNTHFRKGLTALGMGTGDVLVKRVWVVNETKILANVSVAATAPERAFPVSVTTGFELVAEPLGFGVTPADQKRPMLHSEISNPVTGGASLYAGALVLLRVSNTDVENASDLEITVDGAPALVMGWQSNHAAFQIPPGAKVGPAVLRLKAGGVEAYPIVLQIDPLPPVIRQVENEEGKQIGQGAPVRLGGQLRMEVVGLVVDQQAPTQDRVTVELGGVPLRVTSFGPLKDNPDVYELTLEVGESVAVGAPQPLRVFLDGRPSQPVMVPVEKGLK